MLGYRRHHVDQFQPAHTPSDDFTALQVFDFAVISRQSAVDPPIGLRNGTGPLT